MSDTHGANQRLILPFLRPVYTGLHDFAETALRVMIGLALVVHGLPKIAAPLGTSGMIESLGFAPVAFWAVMLAVTEFFGGILLILGLFTRAAAFAGFVVLIITAWVHGITWGEGFAGAEKSLIWAAALGFFAVRGANAQSVDARLSRVF